jgi:hypothetical protein
VATVTRNIGMLLLAIYLILVGLSAVTLIVPHPLVAVVALLAGIFILMGR